MILEPTPMDRYQLASFRMSGYGGAALFLRSGIVDAPAGVLDVGLLTPTDFVWFQERPMTAGLPEKLAEFFFGCARDLHPELTVEAVHDPLCGLDVRVLSSTDRRVELQIEMDGDTERPGSVNFLTSRVGLTRAAADVRVLESAVVVDPRPMPPMDR